MMKYIRNSRIVSVAAFSFLFAYLLSFVFEGNVLYCLLNYYGEGADGYILAAIIAHFAGLFSCGFYVRSERAAKRAMTLYSGVCLIAAVPFFFAPSMLWLIGLVIAGYSGGCAVAAWGSFLKAFTPKDQRIKSCADGLITSNLLMIGVNAVAINISPFIGLALSMLCLVLGVVFAQLLPVDEAAAWRNDEPDKTVGDLKKPMLLLFLFVSVITVNSGLMYQVINSAFEHLTRLVSWYWAVPYIIAMMAMRNLPVKAKRPVFLYVGMGMIMGAFIFFMLLGRGVVDYLVVDTLMLGACGIFDLFWWSIIGEMLDYAKNPIKVFGVGLSANVFGVLLGDVIGVCVTAAKLPGAQVAVIALCVVCVTLVILPPLNRQLVMLLKSHAYLTAYSSMSERQQSAIIRHTKMIEPLTAREEEVLGLILSGKSNREIGEALFIGESTVKTHVRNIFAKFDVGSRAELISIILNNQTNA